LADAFFVRDGDRYLPTEWARGPWSPESQHGGPPSALVGRAIEALEPAGELQLARFTLEILRPIPIAPLIVDARVVRPGKRVQLAEATLSDEKGEVARAHAWRIRPADEPHATIALEPAPYPPPEESPDFDTYIPPWEPSYMTAMETKRAHGSFLEPGPAAAWMRMRVPLIEGEDAQPWDPVLCAGDSGNGISAVLPPDRYLFINTELTVHLVRPPVDEWVCLDAVTRIGPRGIGLAQSILWDRDGRIGAGAQSLLVAPR
jgi:hypothetical protein